MPVIFDGLPIRRENMLKRFALPLLFACAAAAHADILTFGASADTRILSIFPTSNFGADILSTYNFPGNVQRTAMKFDLSSLATSTTVASAKLRLFGSTFNGGQETQTVDIFRINRDWVENQASWTNSDSVTPWANAGGDFVGTGGGQGVNPYSTTAISGNGTGQWHEIDVTSLVAQWVAGTQANQGMMLVGSENKSFTYVQRESTTSSFHPELVIDTNVVPEPATTALFGLAAIAALRKRRK